MDSTGTSPVWWATSRVPVGPERAVTAADPMPGQRARTPSTSPRVTRLPRTFTWSSSLPRYSSEPSGSQRARSPVR
ncbi:hypothetical protein ACFQV2_17885 [Actinokineospora soli]|uniref:Uncharacterized protein n=1 Tax=Actinokineospora soli TaxID=1048753 RepID=A0ABW2TMV6_9PSEU